MILLHTAEILFGASLLYISSTSRLGAYIRILGFQGVLLFVMAVSLAGHMGWEHLGVLSLEALGVKAVVIPLFLNRVIHRNGIRRETEPAMSNFVSLLAATGLMLVAFLFAMSTEAVASMGEHMAMGLAVGAVLVGLLLIISRKKLVTHVMGYLVLENGIFLLSLATATRVPVVVELGVLLDLFIAVFLMGLFATRVHSTFEEHDIEHLSGLVD